MALVRRFGAIDDARSYMDGIGVHSKGAEIMARKALHICVVLSDVDGKCANIIKQEALAAGAEAAVPWQSLTGEGCGRVVVMGTASQLARLCAKLRRQPFRLGERADEMERAIDNYLSDGKRTLRLARGTIPLGERPVIMGVLNVTPDSFYDGGRYSGEAKAIARGKALIAEGADILDVGGESTRPGAKPVTAKEESKRILPIIKAMRGRIISIDTMKARVAEAALSEGASIVNDVSALSDPEMAGAVADSRAAVVLMHMRGNPRTMQKNPKYGDVVEEIATFLEERVGRALSAGVRKESIVIDPGIGFGKTTEHNLEILSRLGELRSLGYPICVGVSRKSFIGKTLGLPPEERLEGTLGAVAAAVMKGADIIRVHDVKECRRAAAVAWGIRNV